MRCSAVEEEAGATTMAARNTAHVGSDGRYALLHQAKLFSFFALPSLLLQMSPYAEVMLTLARGCPPLDSSMHRLQIPKIFNATNTGILRNGGLNASLTAASCGR